MYNLKSTILLALFGAATLASAGQSRCVDGVGDDAAAAACAGFAAGQFRCLTDISYVVCPASGQNATEVCVAQGYHCVQGKIGQGDGTYPISTSLTIHTYAQWSATQTSAPTATDPKW